MMSPAGARLSTQLTPVEGPPQVGPRPASAAPTGPEPATAATPTGLLLHRFGKEEEINTKPV